MIDAFLDKLHAEGIDHDSVVDERSQMMLNITPSTGRFLDLLITDSRPARILELGTSNGYSTVWIARAAKGVNSTVDSVDISSAKSEAAAKNLRSVGLLATVTLHTCDATEFLADCDSNQYDFVFLDSARSQYVSWLKDLLRVTALGTIVVDNAVSHASELADFARCIDESRMLMSCVLPIGKGQMVIRLPPPGHRETHGHVIKPDLRFDVRAASLRGQKTQTTNLAGESRPQDD